MVAPATKAVRDEIPFPLELFFVFWLWVFAFRLTATLFLGVSLLILFLHPKRNRFWGFRPSLLAVVLAALLPYDVDFWEYRGFRGPSTKQGFHWVPYVGGHVLGMYEDAVYGGCLVTGFEPKWILVWD